MKRMRTIGLLFVCLTMSCSSDKPSSPPPVTPNQPIMANDYFFVRDTSEIIILRAENTRRMSEPYLMEEAIIGEPYTDMNGNGQYDNGIDGFVRTSNPATNQDLNYNGQHDGPENMWPCSWYPPIPFDDLDGNGVCRCEAFTDITPDCAYAPFVDWNGNGVWDSVVFVEEKLMKWHVESDVWLWSADYRWLVEPDYYFLSDSGKKYWTNSIALGPNMELHWDQNGGSLVSHGIAFPLFDSTVIVPVTLDTVVLGDGPYFHSAFLRHIEVDVELTIGDTTYTNLLHACFDSMLVESPDYPDLLHWKWDVYFSKDIGLLAFRLRYVQDGRIEESFYSFADRFTGTLPLPMSKVDRP